MYLKRLSLLNYKNFDSRDFEFDNKINCFVGDNGIGLANTIVSQKAIYFVVEFKFPGIEVFIIN